MWSAAQGNIWPEARQDFEGKAYCLTSTPVEQIGVIEQERISGSSAPRRRTLRHAALSLRYPDRGSLAPHLDGDKETARTAFEQAEAEINAMGYHWQDPELAKLRQALD